MIFSRWLPGAALAVGLIAAPANAAIVHVTYEGVVANGFDQFGLFGAANADLTGAAFTATYTLDDAIDASTYSPPLSSSFEFLNLGATTPVGAMIRINGSTFNFWCGYVDYCDVNHTNSAGDGGVYGVESSINIFAVDATTVEIWEQRMSLGLTSTVHPIVGSYDYHTPFTYAFQPGDVATGSLRITDYIMPPTAPGYYVQNVGAQLTPLSVTVTVPEPATWAVMIIGFGLTGAALRRRPTAAIA